MSKFKILLLLTANNIKNSNLTPVMKTSLCSKFNVLLAMLCMATFLPVSGTESAPHSKKRTKTRFYKDETHFIEEFPDPVELTNDTTPIVYCGDLVYKYTDKSPQFPGGEERLVKFIRRNLKYPDKDRKNGVEGIVVVKFIVHKTGMVRNVQVLRKVSPTIDAEALRVVNLLPNFIPGKRNKVSVSVWYTLPIRFRLPK